MYRILAHRGALNRYKPNYTSEVTTSMSQNAAFEYFPVLTARKKQIILASASPRRRELLQQIGLQFEVIPSTFEENLPKDQYHPAKYASTTAAHKAEDVWQQLTTQQQYPAEQLVIISADTVVDIEGVILEKPDDDADAERMLSLLSGKKHEVHTGCAIALKGDVDHEPIIHTFSVTTTVEFDNIKNDVIKSYVKSGEALVI